MPNVSPSELDELDVQAMCSTCLSKWTLSFNLFSAKPRGLEDVPQVVFDGCHKRALLARGVRNEFPVNKLEMMNVKGVGCCCVYRG
jgi:hypothetical protein